MPADEAGRGAAPFEEFPAIAREDAEFVLFHALLRQLREVRYAGQPVRTRRGWRIRRYTAACPVDATHRMVVEQIDGEGALFTCLACEASAARRARLGAALERVTGYSAVVDAQP